MVFHENIRLLKTKMFRRKKGAIGEYSNILELQDIRSFNKIFETGIQRMKKIEYFKNYCLNFVFGTL